MKTPTRSESLERALRPAGGTVTDADLAALGSWAKPHARHLDAWAARVRELLAQSPGRDLASAALEARGEMGARSREDGVRGAKRASDGPRYQEAACRA